MSNWQLGLWLAVMGQRLIELLIAHYNSKWIQQQGGYEVGKRHYPLFFLLHTLFFLGIWLEADSPQLGGKCRYSFFLFHNFSNLVHHFPRAFLEYSDLGSSQSFGSRSRSLSLSSSSQLSRCDHRVSHASFALSSICNSDTFFGTKCFSFS